MTIEMPGDGAPTNLREGVAGILNEEFGLGDDAGQNLEDEQDADELDDELEDQQDDGADDTQDQDDADEDDAEGQSGDVQDAGGETLNDLWKASGLDPAELYNTELRLADGTTVKLGKLKDEVQEAHQLKELLNAERKQFAQEKEAVAQQMHMAMSQAAALPQEARQAQARMDQLADIWNQTDWGELEQDDPGKAALGRQKLEEAFQQAQGVYADAIRQTQQAQAAHYQQTVAQEQAKTLEKIPEWKDQAVLKQDLQAINEVLTGYGFGAQDIAAISDHRVLIALRRLAHLEGQVKQASEELRNPKGHKRVLRPGGNTGSNRAKQVKRRKLEKQVAESGSLREKAAFVGNLLSGA